MNGTLPNSHVEYDSSLIDGCLMDFTGCSGTIAFWAQVPDRDVTILSTVKTFPVNSGISFSWSFITFEIISITGSTIHFSSSSVEFVPFEWYHVAFAYHHNGRATEVALYINSVDSLLVYSFQREDPYSSEAFMASGRGQSGVTGFGLIDELLVFPEYLTGPQIRQLMEIST